jgi:lipoate---protein ligase
MFLIDHSLETPHANLAFDEAMIEAVDPSQPESPSLTTVSSSAIEIPMDAAESLEALRLWEMPSTCVVMGRGSKAAEVNRSACERDSVPVMQRCSGGASIVAGPGCLMYSLLLSLDKHAFVMQRISQAVQSIVPEITLQGTCDLTLADKKFSGNAVRYKRDWLLYHGTLLYRFPLNSVSLYLEMPPRQPAYRESRSHADFLVNLNCDPLQLRRALIRVWQADLPWNCHPYANLIQETAQRILATKYAS